MDELVRDAGVDDDREPARIAGFWRRTGAFFVDTMALGIAGFAVAAAFEQRLAAAGNGALLIGLAIKLAYFGFLDSRWGPTLGKRWLRIRVVDEAGDSISPTRAALRCLVLSVPFYLNGIPMSQAAVRSGTIVFSQTFAVFGLGGALIYLFLFNRTTRQSLHDLVAKTFVVEYRENSLEPERRRLPALHAIVAGSWLLVVAAWFLPTAIKLSQARETSNELSRAYAAVSENPEVIQAKVWWNGEGAERVFGVAARIANVPDDQEKFATTIARLAIHGGLGCDGEQKLWVVLNRGFSLGIASRWRTHRFVKTCGEWAADGSSEVDVSRASIPADPGD